MAFVILLKDMSRLLKEIGTTGKARMDPSINFDSAALRPRSCLPDWDQLGSKRALRFLGWTAANQRCITAT